MNRVEVGYTLKDGGIAPKQGLDGDFGTDLYLREDVILVPSTIGATMAGAGIHTEFNPEEYGMLISLRSSMSKAPVSMANHVGVIEGTYRGEIMIPLRNILNTRNLGEMNATDTVLVWDEGTKGLKNIPTYHITDRLHQQANEQLLAEVELLGGSVEELTYNIAQRKLPKGTLLIEKGTRVAQAYLVAKNTIDWMEKEELTSTNRGSGGFGSTNKKGDK